jgi:hypothetical protein
VTALVELLSLGAGLSGGWSTNSEFDCGLCSVSVRLTTPVPVDEDSCTLSEDVFLTLDFTMSRLLIGSKDTVRSFGTGVWPTSIES